MIEPCASCAGSCCKVLRVGISTSEARALSAATGKAVQDFAIDDATAAVRRLGLIGSKPALSAMRAHLDSFRTSHTLRKGPGGCVFLSDGACSIYEHRPRTCREYTVDRCLGIRERLPL